MRHAQPRVTLVDMEHGGVFHAAEIFVVRISQLIEHVPVDWIRNPCLDQLEQILIIERSIDSVLSHRRE